MFTFISRIWRFAVYSVTVLVMLVVAAVLGIEMWVNQQSETYCYDRVEDCRSGDVALVLGCSKYFLSGKPNSYFYGRMQAAADLWKSGKVRGIIVSGDNRDKYYNEPLNMRVALEKLGVPTDKIVCDSAGLRTYDSVLRAKRIYGLEKVLIISQEDHVARAVTIAQALGMDAVGLNAPLEEVARATRYTMYLRERAARIVMALDILLGKEPPNMGSQQTLSL